MRLTSSIQHLLFTTLALVITTTPIRGDEPPLIQPSFLMDEEPAEKAEPVTSFVHPDLFPLWKRAINRPESDLQRQAAESIVRAHRHGHQGLSNFAPDLMSLVRRKESHPTVRMEAARALIVLDIRDSAPVLAEVSQRDGQLMRQLVEPALADWNYEPIHTVWLARLTDPETPRRDLILAISGLAANRVAAAGEPLRKFAQSINQPDDIRLTAARGAGEILSSGSESLASQLFANGQAPLMSRLCAASLLANHHSAESISLRQLFAVDPNPAVAAIALRSLFQADPELVLPVAETSLRRRDSNVRRIAIETYLRLPTEDRIRQLASQLNDPHPTLRGLVRDGFFEHSRRPEFEGLIRELATGVLGGDDWRGQEQAALLLAALGRKEIAPRLLELLNSPRDEVMIATAWGLRKIAVPETADALVKQIRMRSEVESRLIPGIEHQVGHLCEALALFKHVPALPTLKIYVPKQDKYGGVSRSAAVWAIGQILEDAGAGEASPPRELSLIERAAQALGASAKPPAEEAESLAATFMERIEDVSGMPPELNAVRRTASLSLGRMRAKSQLERLKKLIGPSVDNESVEIAMRWAVLRISGEDLPISPPAREQEFGWFLEPAPSPPSGDAKDPAAPSIPPPALPAQ